MLNCQLVLVMAKAWMVIMVVNVKAEHLLILGDSGKMAEGFSLQG